MKLILIKKRLINSKFLNEKVRTVQEIEKTAPEVYEKLGSGDLQIHEAKVIAQLPEDKRETVLEKKLETKKDIRSIVREINNAEKNQNVKPIPEGKFSIIYADPPREYEFSSSNMRDIENHYPTLELEKIKEIKIPSDGKAHGFLSTVEFCFAFRSPWIVIMACFMMIQS